MSDNNAPLSSNERNALLPCPFCGSADVFVERADYSSCYVQCNGCCTRGPIECQDGDGEDIPGYEAARRAWNRRSVETTAKPYKPGFTQACSSFSDDPDAPSCCCYCGQPREAHPPQSSECPKCDAVRKLGLTSCFEHKQAEKVSEPDDWCCEHGYREHKRGSPACERAAQKASEPSCVHHFDFVPLQGIVCTKCGAVVRVKDADFQRVYADRERLRAALQRIAAWDSFPATGEYWDTEKTRPVSYGAQYGANGERDFMRKVATNALEGGAVETEAGNG